jgi:hypothetical protein
VHLAQKGSEGQKRNMNPPPSPLENPDYSAFAWARYRKLMWGMGAMSAVAVGFALIYLRWSLGELPIVLAIMISIGLMVTLMLMAALMGLVFMSSGSGHDESILDPFEGDENPR